MAALAEPFHSSPQLTVRDLREFRASHLEPLLQAEERDWAGLLDWDFRKSADLVRKFVDMGSLNGAVLTSGLTVVGYSYYVFEDGKGLLGDLYTMPEHRLRHNEELLMNFVMDQIAETGTVPRVEGQIMILSSPLERPKRRWNNFQVFRRAFLLTALPANNTAEAEPLSSYIGIEPWNPAFQEQAAFLIPVTYRGHVDSRINDQYRSVAGARKFLHNIVQFPGCGVFHQKASLAAFDRRSGRLCGMVLASMVAETSGHITQVCVHPDYQGAGLGRALMQSSLELLAGEGCRTVSLTVTTENRVARMFYERLGFRVVQRFGAYVWEP